MTAERVDASALWSGTLAGNARRVAEILRAYGPRTRSELVSLTGLSRPTVTAGLADLTGAGLVSEQVAAAMRPAGGRPASVVRLTRSAGLALGTRAAVLSRGQLVHSQATVGPADAPALAALLGRLAAA